MWCFDWEYRIEKDQTRVSPRLFEGSREKVQCDLECGAPLDDSANSGNVDVLFTCGECGFSYFGSWSCSEE